jgi:predicted nucleotidyltransferase
MQELNQILKILIDAKVDFVLVGGYAGIVHGASQMTRDLDICAALTDENVSKLRDCLKDLSPKHRMNPNVQPSFIEHPKSLEGVNAIYLQTDLGVLDVISSVTAVGDFPEIKKQAIEIEFFGKKCLVMSLEHLIAAKEAMGRDKDKAILKELYEIRDKN